MNTISGGSKTLSLVTGINGWIEVAVVPLSVQRSRGQDFEYVRSDE
jgi:hypothetical protein